MKGREAFILLAAVAALAGGCAEMAENAPGRDLVPATLKRPKPHPPVVLVREGEPLAKIAVMVPKEKTSRVLRGAITDLRQFIERSTGATLEVVHGKVDGPAIVIGDCELARENGLVGSDMPADGFTVKTCEGAVLIVGRDGELAPRTESNGTAWGIYDFLERFLNVRWYFPGELGASVPKRRELVIDPAWIEDAPVFRFREIWPSGGRDVGPDVGSHHRRLRSGNSWPVHLVVHAPHSWKAEYAESRPEIFQLSTDGSRNFAMLCYGNPRTLETYLENIEAHYERGEKTRLGIVGDAITVSPNDMAVACRCADCRALWDDDGGRYGTASRVVATFVAKLAREVERRWPGKLVIYLPYVNYTKAPEGIDFPGNVRVQLCGMPGLAQYKEPAVRDSEQRNIDAWVRLTGHRIQNWHYSCWPAEWTKAAFLYPHTVKEHYLANRDRTVGSFINGTGDHWPRQHVTLYCWMKVLWDPEFDVDLAISEYCRRMYGPAGATVEELVRMQIDGWERSAWPDARFSPKAVYGTSYPREKVIKMEALLAKAREEATGDELVLKRLDYCAGPLREFFAESKALAEGTGKTPLVVRKVAENPIVDGRLDDEVWKEVESEAASFVRAQDRENPEPRFPTTMRAVWTLDGVTFGFRMAEPEPAKLARKIGGRDQSLAWWDDNVEVFLDVKGDLSGYYQLIVNANGAVFDARSGDVAWTCEGLKVAAHAGDDFWSLEVFVPTSALPDAVRPGTGVEWKGNFTRHRVCDGNPREYQRLNTTYQPTSSNMNAFGPIRFVE